MLTYVSGSLLVANQFSIQNDNDISINCSIAADYATLLDGDEAGETCLLKNGALDPNPGVQGQIFDTRGFNVINAFANCNLPPTNGPDQQG